MSLLSTGTFKRKNVNFIQFYYTRGTPHLNDNLKQITLVTLKYFMPIFGKIKIHEKNIIRLLHKLF